MYEIRFEPETGILRSVNSGFWTMAEAHRYLNDIVREASSARARTGKLRLLVDGVDANVLAADVAVVLGGFERSVIGSPMDRIAVVVGSSIAKMQTRRGLGSGQSEVFVSPSAAQTWLLTHDDAAAAARPDM